MRRRTILIIAITIAFVILMRMSTSHDTAIVLTPEIPTKQVFTTFENNEIATSTTETETIKKETVETLVVVKEPEKKIEISLPLQIPTKETPPPAPLIPDSQLYAAGLERTVNLICIINQQEFVTATGAIISPSGYILTNAHIIDNSSDNVECSVRRGSPAQAFATAHLVFLPEGYRTATTEEEKARYDFSVWKIKEPGIYAFWNMDFESAFTEHEVLRTQSYPAELLGGNTIMKSLNLVFSNTAVTATDTYIVKSTSNLSAQHGSSGGVLIDPRTAKIRSLIFAVGPETAISERALYSLSPKAINETTTKETNESFPERFVR